VEPAASGSDRLPAGPAMGPVPARGLAARSSGAPACPGRPSTGGGDSIAGSSRPDSGTASSAGTGLPSTTRAADLEYRRSRPLASTTAPRIIRIESSAPEAPADTGASAQARRSDPRSRKTGAGEATAPAGMATTTVRPSYGPSPLWLNLAAPFAMAACWHAAAEPTGPAKQAARVTATGALTRTVARPIGTSHWVPTAFQYSSS